MTREEAIVILKDEAEYKKDYPYDRQAFEMAIQALSQMSEIEENIIKYMKKYPNHVGNTDFWEGFYACCNVVLQLDDEEYAPKEQEPCDDAISREAVIEAVSEGCQEWRGIYGRCEELINALPSVTQKSGKWIKKEDDTCWWYACSECEQEPLKNRWNDDDVLSAFCPNCGAKMKSKAIEKLRVRISKEIGG